MRLSRRTIWLSNWLMLLVLQPVLAMAQLDSSVFVAHGYELPSLTGHVHVLSEQADQHHHDSSDTVDAQPCHPEPISALLINVAGPLSDVHDSCPIEMPWARITWHLPPDTPPPIS